MRLHFLSICAGLSFAAIVPAAPIYVVHDLGTGGGNSAGAFGVNASGTAAGTIQLANGANQAFAGATYLPSNGLDSRAAAINNAGQVAGTVTGNGASQAGVWDQNGFQGSGGLGGTNSYGMAINSAGQLAGGAETVGGQLHAFVNTGGSVNDLGALAPGGWSSAYGINDSGSVAGYGTAANGNFMAFIWTAQGGLQQIGTLGGRQSYAVAINASDEVVGGATLSNGFLHAFSYDHGSRVDLGTLGGGFSFAYGIDAAGQIVGYSAVADGMHGFLVDQGQMLDLNSLLISSIGWTITAAYGINDAGQIAGAASWGGVEHAVRLDPVTVADDFAAPFPVPPLGPTSADLSSVPEPAPVIALAIGLSLLLWLRSRSRPI